MEKDRGTKAIAIVALLIGVVGLSVGFAAMSSTLTIESSADVAPSENDFTVQFSTSSTTIAGTTVNGVVDFVRRLIRHTVVDVVNQVGVGDALLELGFEGDQNGAPLVVDGQMAGRHGHGQRLFTDRGTGVDMAATDGDLG